MKSRRQKDRRSVRERQLYPVVERWLKKDHRCFKTATNAGLRNIRVDVTGVRDIGGDLSGEVETTIVEVKKGQTPFATASGQTLGYRVYANRVYLADLRTERFGVDELDIASQLGVGLIQIQDKKCVEVLSSPYYTPITRLNLLLLERLALGKCQMCGCFFEIGVASQNRWKRLAREKLDQAINNERGLMYWNREVAERKDRVGIREVSEGTTYERRFVCPDCITYFFSKLKG